MKKAIIATCIFGIMLVSSGISISATRIGNVLDFDNVSMSKPLNYAVTNLTVQEAWDMLNGSCSYEIPIDVRRNDEWNPERIDTPIPEHPRHYCLDRLQDETLLEKFISIYDGIDIIVYCKKGGRSWKAANIILNAGFTGKIYNMVGGITEWNLQGLPTTDGAIYNISVEEVRELCKDTGDGLQVPVDVRYDYEWYAGFIDTPWPECPIWYCKTLFEDPDGIAKFCKDYECNEVILYCKGGYRSLLCCYMLIEAGFNGTIYNMLGGITAWIAEGYPIRNNSAPAAPEINGPEKGGAGVNLTFELSTTDAEDDAVYYLIDWNDSTTSELTRIYAIDETASLVHLWEEKGTYTITAKAIDFYGNESEVATFDVKIPRNKASNYNLIELFFEKFPFAFSILRYLMEL